MTSLATAVEFQHSPRREGRGGLARSFEVAEEGHMPQPSAVAAIAMVGEPPRGDAADAHRGDFSITELLHHFPNMS